MARWNGNIIEHPEAYRAAITRNIHGRANAKRRREWAAAHPQLEEWAGWGDDYQGPAYASGQYQPHRLGAFPKFAREAMEKWGAPTEKATELLQRIFDERTANVAKREEQRAAERAAATAWQPGRQQVEGEVISVKATEGFAPYYGAPLPTVWKMLVKREDGSKIYLTVPRTIEDAYHAAFEAAHQAQTFFEASISNWLKGKRVRFTVKVEPKAEEPTFAFGSRPTKGEIL